VVTVQFATVGQLEDPLANFLDRSVHFVKEENHRLFTSHLEPIGRIEAGTVTVDARQTNQVTLGHLAGSTLHNRKLHVLGDLINHLGLTNTVASS
jgi:hypothetical protein